MLWWCNLIAQLFGLFGFLLLSGPALHAAKYARLVTKLDLARPRRAGAPGAEAYRNALHALTSHRDSWGWWKSALLISGTFLTIGSFALATGVAAFAP